MEQDDGWDYLRRRQQQQQQDHQPIFDIVMPDSFYFECFELQNELLDDEINFCVGADCYSWRTIYLSLTPIAVVVVVAVVAAVVAAAGGFAAAAGDGDGGDWKTTIDGTKKDYWSCDA